MQKGGQPKTNYNVKIKANKEMTKNLNLDIDIITANLEKLKNKHPENFDTFGKVYRTIQAIQNNPNRYFKNNRLDIDLVAKDLQDGSLGKMGIVNQGENIGKVGHLSITSKRKYEKEIERLKKKNKQELGGRDASPYTPHK